MIKTISPRTFRPYGWVIEFPAGKIRRTARHRHKNLFAIVKSRRGASGWRIAYLVVRERSIRRLERHPGVLESFEPVKGRCILYVSSSRAHDRIAAFYLNRPVILKQGLWHGVVTVTARTEIKITEDARVRSEYWRLPFSLDHLPLP